MSDRSNQWDFPWDTSLPGRARRAGGKGPVRRVVRPCHSRHPVPMGGLELGCGCRWTYTEGAWVKIWPCAAHPIRVRGWGLDTPAATEFKAAA